MDEELQAELIRRMEADAAAVRGFLASADSYRDAFNRQPEAQSTIPWPYVALDWSPEATAPEEVRRVLATVRDNTDRLRQVVAEHGWPGRSLVGEGGADAAWLILQHAGSGVPSLGTPESLLFQASCIPLLYEAVRRGEAHPRHLAHVVDNVRERAGDQPEYAVLASAYTVEDGHVTFKRPVDLLAIDRRRAEIGLPPFESDIQRRARGEQLSPAGANRADPWPD
jgi:hypothetical protein